jgi:hypothetical protein
MLFSSLTRGWQEKRSITLFIIQIYDLYYMGAPWKTAAFEHSEPHYVAFMLLTSATD